MFRPAWIDRADHLKAFRRDDGWVVHFCIRCNSEVTHQLWQQYGPDDDFVTYCDPCAELSRREDREHSTWYSR